MKSTILHSKFIKVAIMAIILAGVVSVFPTPASAHVVTIYTTKIVCDSEKYLPNRGENGPSIVSTTATDWLAEGDNAENCEIVDWDFQWAPGDESNPGDNTGVAGGNWTSFSNSTAVYLDELTDSSMIWVREVWNDLHIPFTGVNTTQDVSAEIYCHEDVLNYDNYDHVVSPVDGGSYYCVAWNVLAEDDSEEPEVLEVTTTLAADPSTIDVGGSSTLAWTSTNATICDSPWTTATSTSGSQVVTPSISTTYLITCGNGTATSTASTTVSINSNNGGGGGGGGGGGSGGGGGGGGSSSRSRGGQVLGTATPALLCPLINDYMRIDFANNPVEVTKLQAFLVNFEGHKNLAVNGVFDQATFDAVSAFQAKYFSDVLAPWGHTGPTGFVYITTKKKINEIFCQKMIVLTQAQINEINAFRTLITSPEYMGTGGGNDTVGANTVPDSIDIPEIVIKDTPTEESESYEENGNGDRILASSIAAALFARPDGLVNTLECMYEFLLVLIVLYILGSILESVLYKNTPENTKKRFVSKWIFINIGLVTSIVAAYMMGVWCLLLPLIVALVIALIWALTYPSHTSIRASVKSWYLVVSARAKSLAKENSKIVIPMQPPSQTQQSAPASDAVIHMGPPKPPAWPL